MVELNRFQVAPFTPHRLAKGGQAQTLAGKFLKSKIKLYAEERVTLVLPDGDRTLLQIDECHPSTSTLPINVLILHGLGGSGDSDYCLRLATKFTSQGIRTIRFNHRGCGRETASWAKQIYHCGSIDDVDRAVSFCRKRWPHDKLMIIGFSLSGSILLHLLGKRKVDCDLAISVSAPLDLESCSLQLSRFRNTHLNLYYTKVLIDQAQRRRQHHPDEHHPQLPQKINLRVFDDCYTAKLSGYGTRERYYQDCSPRQYLDRIQTPTIMLNALDDPLTPPQTLQNIPESEILRFIGTCHGGHMGYICSQKTFFSDQRWLDEVLFTIAKEL